LQGKVTGFLKRLKDAGAGFYLASVCCLSLLLFVFILNLFSDALVIGFNSNYIDETRGITVKALTLYAVQYGETDSDKGTAFLTAETVKSKGGAGYIVFDKGYHVLASCYESKKDAESVVSRLKKDKIRCSVYIISVNEFKVKLVNGTAEQTAFVNSLNFFFSVYKSLYALSVELDSALASQPTVKANIYELKKSAEALLSGLERESGREILFVTIKARYIAMINILNALSDLNVNSGSLSGDIKYAYLEIILGYDKMINEIN
jgi:hypothetical protein